MRRLALLVFLLLVVPGSGRLVFDGLPLSTRAEFAALVLCIIVFFSRNLREGVRRLLPSTESRPSIGRILLLLCFVKFFTFAWSPMSQGFEACYRSLYVPIADPQACEKSFDGPFLRARGLPLANTSRVDPTVDFGGAPYDWSLPFMNEYPRLGQSWLNRFPFSAVYSARVSSDGERFVPVRAIGEVSVSVNGREAASVTNYDRHFLSAVALPAGESELLVSFAYRDDDETEPESPPVPRGPYAQLKIGEPMTKGELLAASRVLLVADLASGAASRVAVTDRDGDPVEAAVVPAPEEGSLSRRFDVEIELAASALERSPLRVTADGREIATITAATNDPFRLDVTPAAGTQASAILTAERDALDALAPAARTDPNPALGALLALLDLATLAILAALAYVLARTMRRDLAHALALGAAAWLAVEPLDAILPGFAGGGRELVIPYALIALAVVALRRPIQRYPLAYLLPLASVLATQKILDHIHYNHPGHHPNWWGKLIYQWRDGDWFAKLSNARSILLESSLRAGEPVFHFRAGPRYLLYVGQMLLGENDVLIGLVAMTVGFIVVCLLAARFADRDDTTATRAAAAFVAFISLIFLGDQTIVAFAFFVSSEYPTWIAMLAVTAFLINPAPEHRAWVTTTLAATLAALVHFRPNNLLPSILLFVLLVLRARRDAAITGTNQVSSVLSGFFVVFLLSLLHNLYYGGQFVLFTPNPSNMYAFDVAEIARSQGVLELFRVLWGQLGEVMYWRVPNDPSYMIFFWGCQLALVAALVERVRRREFLRPTTLVALLPLTYIAPMLKFLYDSYFPRLIVSASLLCLCAGLIIASSTVRTTKSRS